MGDEALKVQAFRFVDVLPTLRTHESVTSHLREYFTDVSRLPGPARLALSGDPNSMVGKALAVGARWNARQMADRFIAGRDRSRGARRPSASCGAKGSPSPSTCWARRSSPTRRRTATSGSTST